MKKLFTLVYLTIVFHLPVWRSKYKNKKYAYLETMPKWMQTAISIRNEYERGNDTFYWAKFGPFYIRSNHSYPGCDHFRSSKYHLFVIRKNIIKYYIKRLKFIMVKNRVDINSLLGSIVKCDEENHDPNEVYTVFEVNEARNTAKIQAPSDRKAHWVNVKHLFQ